MTLSQCDRPLTALHSGIFFICAVVWQKKIVESPCVNAIYCPPIISFILVKLPPLYWHSM